MVLQVLKICLDKNNEATYEDAMTEGFFDSVTDNYDYDCVLLDFNGAPYVTFREAEWRILGNNNYLRLKHWIFNCLIFINTKIMSEYKAYRYFNSDYPMHDVSINMCCLVNDINCPCVIYSSTDITQLESFAHVKLERLPCDRIPIYIATERDIMIKKAQHATITMPKTKQ